MGATSRAESSLTLIGSVPFSQTVPADGLRRPPPAQPCFAEERRGAVRRGRHLLHSGGSSRQSSRGRRRAAYGCWEGCTPCRARCWGAGHSHHQTRGLRRSLRGVGLAAVTETRRSLLPRVRAPLASPLASDWSSGQRVEPAAVALRDAPSRRYCATLPHDAATRRIRPSDPVALEIFCATPLRDAATRRRHATPLRDARFSSHRGCVTCFTGVLRAVECGTGVQVSADPDAFGEGPGSSRAPEGTVRTVTRMAARGVGKEGRPPPQSTARSCWRHPQAGHGTGKVASPARCSPFWLDLVPHA